MQTTLNKWIAPWLIATLIASTCCLPGCAYLRSLGRTDVVVLPADRVVKPLDNGNYEVSAGWLKERYEYEAWITRRLEECEGER